MIAVLLTAMKSMSSPQQHRGSHTTDFILEFRNSIAVQRLFAGRLIPPSTNTSKIEPNYRRAVRKPAAFPILVKLTLVAFG